MKEEEPKSWQEVLAAHPEAQPGRYNLERIKLLKRGVHFDFSRLMAESKIPLFRERRKIAEASAEAQGQGLPPIEEPVRITIVETPELTEAGFMEGPVIVEVNGEQYTIEAGILAHCIANPTDTPVVSFQGSFQGFGERSAGGDGSGWSHD